MIQSRTSERSRARSRRGRFDGLPALAGPISVGSNCRAVIGGAITLQAENHANWFLKRGACACAARRAFDDALSVGRYTSTNRAVITLARLRLACDSPSITDDDVIAFLRADILQQLPPGARSAKGDAHGWPT